MKPMTWSADLGRLLPRLSLGGLLVLHGIAKIRTGAASILGLMTRLGLPEALGYMVYAGEVVAPILLMLGLWTRPAAIVVAVNMVVAVLLVHAGQFAELTRSGGWALELQAFYFLTAVAISLLGAGRFSVGGATGRFN